MKLVKQAAILKEHGFKFDRINRQGFPVYQYRESTIKLFKSRTKAKLMEKIIGAIEHAHWIASVETRRRMRQRMRQSVVQGGKWHNLESKSRAKLILIRGAA